MSKQVEPALAPVATEVKEQPVSTTAGEQSPVVDKELVAQLVGQAQRQGLSVEGEDGLLGQLTKLVLESALEGEITAHLGYDKHERSKGVVEGNARNGTRSKTVLTKAGPVEVDVPRDRAGSFEPVVVRKRQRRLGSIEDIVLSLSARGLTTGDIPNCGGHQRSNSRLRGRSMSAPRSPDTEEAGGSNPSIPTKNKGIVRCPLYGAVSKWS